MSSPTSFNMARTRLLQARKRKEPTGKMTTAQLQVSTYVIELLPQSTNRLKPWKQLEEVRS